MQEEGDYALALEHEGHLKLIPIMLKDTKLDGFLGHRDCVDFRSDSDYDRSIDTLVLRGIMECKVMVFFQDVPISKDPEDWTHLTKVVRESPVELTNPYDGHGLSEGVLYEMCNNENKRGLRTVVISDPFCYWGWEEVNPERTQRLISEIFDLRDRTCGIEAETIFAFYTHPDALDKAPHQLDSKIQERLSHYFRIQMMFFYGKGGEEPTENQLNDLRSGWKKTWHTIQTLLLENERRYFGKNLECK